MSRKKALTVDVGVASVQQFERVDASAICLACYNLCRKHDAFMAATPAMSARLADKVTRRFKYCWSRRRFAFVYGAC